MGNNTLMTTFVALACCVASAGATEESSAPSAERGKEAVWSVASPLSMSVRSWNTIRKQWQLADRPQDFDKRAQDRNGLLPSPRHDDRFPLGRNELKTVVGPVLSNNCLLCHAGRIAGQTVIGLGNASLDMQSLQEDLAAGELLSIRLPFKIGNGRGIIEAGAGTTYLLQFRDAEMNLAPMRKLKFSDQRPSPPTIGRVSDFRCQQGVCNAVTLSDLR